MQVTNTVREPIVDEMMQKKESVNCENHPIRIAKREKKQKKRRSFKEPVGQHRARLCLHYWVPEAGKREDMTENIFEEIMAENFSNLVKKTDI